MNDERNIEAIVLDERYDKPMGKYYVDPAYIDDSLKNIANGSYSQNQSFFKQFFRDMVLGYRDAFLEIYSGTKKVVSQVKNKVNDKFSESNYLIEAGKMDVEYERKMLMDVLSKEVKEKVKNYLSSHSYEKNISEKVQTAYEYGVRNSLLALEREELESILVETLRKDSSVDKSYLIKNYADDYVARTIDKTIHDNLAVSKYVIPRMDLSAYNNSPAIVR